MSGAFSSDVGPDDRGATPALESTADIEKKLVAWCTKLERIINERVGSILSAQPFSKSSSAEGDRAFLRELERLQPLSSHPGHTAVLLQRYLPENLEVREVLAEMDQTILQLETTRFALQSKFESRCRLETTEKFTQEDGTKLFQLLRLKERLTGLSTAEEATKWAIGIYKSGIEIYGDNDQIPTLLARFFAHLNNKGESPHERASYSRRLPPLDDEQRLKLYANLLLPRDPEAAGELVQYERLRTRDDVDASRRGESSGKLRPKIVRHLEWLLDDKESGILRLHRLSDMNLDGNTPPRAWSEPEKAKLLDDSGKNIRTAIKFARAAAERLLTAQELALWKDGVISRPMYQKELGPLLDRVESLMGKDANEQVVGLSEAEQAQRNHLTLGARFRESQGAEAQSTKIEILKGSVISEVITYKERHDPSSFKSTQQFAGMIEVSSTTVLSYLQKTGEDHPWFKVLLECRKAGLPRSSSSDRANAEKNICSTQYILNWFELTDADIQQIVENAIGPIWEKVNSRDLTRILQETRAAVRDTSDPRADREILSDKGLNEGQIEDLAGLATRWARASKGHRFRGHLFDSAIEAASAVMLERFWPGFDVVEGSTYQWPTRTGHYIDFRLDLPNGRSLFVEIHPIVKADPRSGMSDFKSSLNYLRYVSAKGEIEDDLKLSKEERARGRRRIDTEIESKLGDEYISARYKLIATRKRPEDFETALVRSGSELYDLLLRQKLSNPAAEKCSLPDRAKFVEQFDELRRAFQRLKHAENDLSAALLYSHQDAYSAREASAALGQLFPARTASDGGGILGESGERVVPLLREKTKAATGKATRVVEIFDELLNGSALSQERRDSEYHSNSDAYMTLARRKGCEALVLDAATVLDNPSRSATRVAEFIGRAAPDIAERLELDHSQIAWITEALSHRPARSTEPSPIIHIGPFTPEDYLASLIAPARSVYPTDPILEDSSQEEQP